MPETWVPNQDKLPGFRAPRETCDSPNKDPAGQAALHSRFEDITGQDPALLEGTRPPQLSGGNVTPVGIIKADDSGTPDEDDFPEHGLTAPEITEDEIFNVTIEDVLDCSEDCEILDLDDPIARRTFLKHDSANWNWTCSHLSR